VIGYFTVAHTGTQYFRKHYFGQPGLDWKDLGSLAHEGDVVFAHCEARHEAGIRAWPHEIVTTLRDPWAVAVSWFARGKLVSGYTPWRTAWRVWLETVQPRASRILRVDEAHGEPINSVRHNSLAHYFYDRKDPALFTLIDREEVNTICDQVKYARR
jgi:hypothetical protein